MKQFINLKNQKNKDYEKAMKSLQRAEFLAWGLFVGVGLAYIILSIVSYFNG